MSEPEPPPPKTGGVDDDDDPPELTGPSPKRWGTVSLIVLNLAVGVVMAWAGVPVFFPTDSSALVDFGAVEPTRVWSGEVWRLLTACFVHVGTWHLGLNLWVLWQVGRALERLMGTARFVLIYVASGLFGFALSVALMPGLTAGASGAVFGVTGALLAIASLTRHRPLGRFLLTSLLPFVVATAAFGLLIPFMNNVAHFGGLLMGFLLGYGLNAGDRSFVEGTDADRASAAAAIHKREQTLGPAALVVSLALFAAVVVYAVEPRLSPRYHAMMGLRDLHTASTALPVPQKEALESARHHVARAHALARDDAGTHLLTARLLEQDGKLDEARAEAAKGFARFAAESSGGAGDRNAAFERALLELGLVESHQDDAGDMPYADGFTVRALCDAAVDASPGQAPQLKNSCAWLLLRAHEPAVRDPARALVLAREAWEESGKDEAAIVHTWACALAQNGRAAEGLALLEQLTVNGSGSLDASFVNAERARLQQLIDAAAKTAMPDGSVTNVPSPTEVH